MERRDFIKLSGTGAAALAVTPAVFSKVSQSGKVKEYPFLFGAQYYRAPTPEADCWAQDFTKMKDLGFNMVKFWVQWRWNHRGENTFYFDDVDKLMDLAASHDLKVTLNTIFDVSPLWLYDKYPDAKQVMNNGHVIEPAGYSHRQIGGIPGPCYNHPDALGERKKFMEATLNHFRNHKAMSMWDVWNEPELSFPQRNPNIDTMACYCPSCKNAFVEWLKQKYSSIDTLNKIWGRNYESWQQIELPRSAQLIRDFIDWREFHNDTMTSEATWRIDMAKKLDPDKIVYLHVVPNTMQPFNSVTTCADDFEMAKKCDVFASTMNGNALWESQLVSAANGKICYNVESHMNGGTTNFHQKILGEKDLLNDLLPQIGYGIKGFLFWQFRAEVLGLESPAWGLVNPDGSDRSVTGAFRSFRKKITPIIPDLMESFPATPRIGIWKSRKNEIFHFAINNNLDSLTKSVSSYIYTLYYNNFEFRIISGQMLENNELSGIDFLIMPSCYYVTEAEAKALDAFVKNGGTIFNEAHLAAYNGTTGRHSMITPGCGLSESWSIKEEVSTSSYNLKLENAEKFLGELTPDVKKMLADLGTTGAKFFPIKINDSNTILWGANRYAELSGNNLTTEATFNNKPCIVSKNIGKGKLYYCGTNLGEGSEKDYKGFTEILLKVLKHRNINSVLNTVMAETGSVHVDALYKKDKLKFVVIRNIGNKENAIQLKGVGNMKGLYSSINIESDKITVPADFADIFV
jgi:beta-galactosidase